MDSHAGELWQSGIPMTWTGPRKGAATDAADQTIAAALESSDAAASSFDAASDERTLVSAVVSGQRAAFDVIVERHRRVVYQVCFRLMGNHEDASDLAQDAFIRAYRAMGKFKGDSSLGTWLYRIAVNVCLNRLALKTPQTEALELTQHVDTRREPPDEPVLRGERAAMVKAAIARLPKKQRATVILRVYHELPHDEIAAILGSSVGAVKANFFHALNNLRRLLGGGSAR